LKLRALAFTLALVSIVGIGAPPAVVWAEPDAATLARQAFEAGNRAFDEARYSEALAAYRHSYELVKRPNTIYNIAKCQDLLGKTEDAILEYQRFIDAGGGDPGLIERAKAKLVDLKKLLMVQVPVTSTPANALIRLDGADSVVARTPATLSLTDGKHELLLTAPMYKPARRTVEVGAGKHDPIDVTLQQIGAIAITTDPSDARIEIEGRDTKGYGELTGDIDPGTYKVTVRRDGFKPQTVEVVITAGNTTRQRIALENEHPIVKIGDQNPPPHNDRSELRIAGVVTGVVGLVAIGVGVQQGIMAKNASDRAQMAARDMNQFDSIDYDSATAAQSRSFILYAAGAAAVITGTVLYLVGRSGESPTVQPVVGVGQVGVGFTTKF
jgi:hypothetical protein